MVASEESCLSCLWYWGGEIIIHLAIVYEMYGDLCPELMQQGKKKAA